MNIKYLLKADYKKFSQFTKTKYKNFEAYVSWNHNLTKIIQNKINIINIHAPGSVRIDKKNYTLDLISTNKKIKYASRKYFIKLIKFSQKNNIPNIVVHVGFYNRKTHSKNNKLLELRNFLEGFNKTNVNICIENVPRWFTLYGKKEPLISNIDDLKKINEWGGNIFPILDVDHIAIDTAFKEFQNNFKINLSNFPFKNISYEKKYLDFAYKNKKNIAKKINQNIRKIIKFVKPKYYHAVGSDFTKYIMDPSLPLVGEALPLGYKGKIGSYHVNDIINHKEWIKMINWDSTITLEQFFRTDYNYLDQIKKTSKKYNINI